MVGIPGKIVKRADPDMEEALDIDPTRREAICQKFGFDAYGVSQDMPDPVARSMQAAGVSGERPASMSCLAMLRRFLRAIIKITVSELAKA